MHIQGRRLKSDKEPQKGVLNEFSDNRIIKVTEKEVGDIVDVKYQLYEGDKGYFSQEYRADTVAKKDAKVIDITAVIINEKKGVCSWWLYDLKKDVGGQDVVLHLCGQWKAAYQYLKNSVLNYLADASDVAAVKDTPVEIRGNVGVITRNFDAGRIQGEYEMLDEKIREMESDAKQVRILGRQKAGVVLPTIRVKRDMLENILNKKICFRCDGKDVEFPIDVKISTRRGEREYYYCLLCSQPL